VKSAQPLRTIDPADGSFSDLTRLGQEIGPASIVFLGEQSHGDGGSITARTRLVKYLHMEKGFDVLAFEADFFSCAVGWEQLKDESGVGEFAKNNIYGFWSQSAVSDQLWRFIAERRRTDRPLIVAGIDVRHVGNLAKEQLAEQIKKILAEIKPDLLKTHRFGAFDAMLKSLLEKENRLKLDQKDRKLFHETLDEIAGLVSDSSLPSKEFWNHEINNLRGFAKYSLEGQNRDKFMAANLSWLVRQKFPNKKIIVWSHSNHNILDVQMYAAADPVFAKNWFKYGTYEWFTYLGADAYREFGEKTYSLGTLSYTGSISPNFFFGDGTIRGDYVTTQALKPSSAASLEFLLAQKNFHYAFIPLPNGSQGSPTKYPWFTTRAIDLSFEKEMDYVSSYDGFIFIKETFGLSGKP
jgi:erythromycin esterase-like protein